MRKLALLSLLFGVGARAFEGELAAEVVNVGETNIWRNY